MVSIVPAPRIGIELLESVGDIEASKEQKLISKDCVAQGVIPILVIHIVVARVSISTVLEARREGFIGITEQPLDNLDVAHFYLSSRHPAELASHAKYGRVCHLLDRGDLDRNGLIVVADQPLVALCSTVLADEGVVPRVHHHAAPRIPGRVINVGNLFRVCQDENLAAARRVEQATKLVTCLLVAGEDVIYRFGALQLVLQLKADDRNLVTYLEDAGRLTGYSQIAFLQSKEVHFKGFAQTQATCCFHYASISTPTSSIFQHL